MHIVHYTKHFLTGNLAGLEVRVEHRECNAEHAQRYLEHMATYTRDQPGADCVTGSQFWVSFGD